MSIDTLLERVEGVRAKGGGQWSCKCPAHRDSSPSLTIRQVDDGTILIHCFAGCEPNDILAALGMNIRDLFPRALGHHRLPKRRRGISAFEALRAVRFEVLVLAFIAEDIATGQPHPELCRRAQLAAGRINTALSLCDG